MNVPLVVAGKSITLIPLFYRLFSLYFTVFCDFKYHFLENFISNSGMVVYSLLPHEQRMTVVNMVLNKYPNCGIPIANKQKLLFYVGYRRFEAQPIFSQHTNGDKFKVTL